MTTSVIICYVALFGSVVAAALFKRQLLRLCTLRPRHLIEWLVYAYWRCLYVFRRPRARRHKEAVWAMCQRSALFGRFTLQRKIWVNPTKTATKVWFRGFYQVSNLAVYETRFKKYRRRYCIECRRYGAITDHATYIMPGWDITTTYRLDGCSVCNQRAMLHAHYRIITRNVLKGYSGRLKLLGLPFTLTRPR